VRSFGWAVALAAIWVLLWGSASPANVLSGLAIGTLLVLVVPGLRRRGGGRARVRPLAVARLVGSMLVTTVRSNAELTREVLSPSSRLRTAIVAVPLPDCSDEVVTLISDLLALSPGTMPIELRSDPLVLYVHVLHRGDLDRVRADLLRLTDVTVRAFGTDEAIASQTATMARMERPR
jgi:multicomponent Na+:H+ antiporter subunit E